MRKKNWRMFLKQWHLKYKNEKYPTLRVMIMQKVQGC